MSVVNLSLKRREFLGAATATAGALFLGFHFPTARAAAGGTINAYVSIDATGKVTLMNPFIEMGQGTWTSIPMILAEELDADMAAVRVVDAPLGPEYRLLFGKTMRITGGSASVRGSYDALRETGASARAMLMAAAAQQWSVPASELTTEPGFVLHAASKRRAAYGDLAGAASQLAPPESVTLKDPAEFRLLGKPTPRTDAFEKSSGRAIFGIDIREENMLIAAIRHAPVFGGKVASIDKTKAQAMPGVVAVEDLGNAVAVLADNTWRARMAADALAVTFADGPEAKFSSAVHVEKLRGRLNDAGHSVENEGDIQAAFAAAAKTIEAEYHAPFLAHATMEPQNCTALVRDGRCIVWAPNQGADFVGITAAEITKLPIESVEVHTPFLGGGFGRRIVLDYVRQAVTLADRHKGRTVKVTWSREEDTQHDYYRPLVAAKYRAAFDKDGKPIAIHATTVGDGPARQLGWQQDPKVDGSVMEGAYKQPYSVPNRRSDFVFESSPAPLGFWRSVGHSQNGFFKESFMDEMAHAAGKDPVEFRRSLLGKSPRYLKVLDTAVAMAGWRGGKWKAADGREHAMGVALHESFGSIVCEVAEVSLDGDGQPAVHKVWAAVDCGFSVNPLVLVHQVESAIAYGLSAALHEEVTIENGRTTNGNFDTYPILTAQRMPDVDVQVINSGEALGGIGEVGTPPIAPAVCNALFTLTGKRVRSLPLRSHSFA
jgi:isoquinoline 1-oxidoreductase beta subunit